MKYFNIALVAFGFITAIVFIKYKPIYKVSILGEKVGYVQNKEALEESIKQKAGEIKQENIDNIQITKAPEYELKFVERTIETNEKEIAEQMQENIVITYKYYEVALNNKTIENVDNLEEAEQLVNHIKEKNDQKELSLTIVEKYTEKVEEIKTEELEIAKTNSIEKVANQLLEEQKGKEEEERIKNLPQINGIKLAVSPVSGTITSRYGVSSRIRKSTHTGLDIAAKTGTPIQAIADGTVTCASYQGAYGKLIKIDHGNGVVTWYAHTSKMYVKAGQKVTAGDTIGAVGSTGNSTGPHLHLEIRINGVHVNPQRYLYK